MKSTADSGATRFMMAKGTPRAIVACDGARRDHLRSKPRRIPGCRSRRSRPEQPDACRLAPGAATGVRLGRRPPLLVLARRRVLGKLRSNVVPWNPRPGPGPAHSSASSIRPLVERDSPELGLQRLEGGGVPVVIFE